MMQVQATTGSDGSAILTIDGQAQKIIGSTIDDARQKIIARVASAAAAADEPAHMTTQEPDGTWYVLVHPDGTVTEEGEPAPVPAPEPAPEPIPPRISTPRAAEKEQLPPAAAVPPPRITTAAAGEHAAQIPQLEPVVVADAAPWQTIEQQEPPRIPTRSEPHATFLTPQRVEEPAKKGVRGVLTRAGLRLAPGAAEKQERHDAFAVSQHWPGPRTIAIVNGKGGASKTPTTVLLSAVFARLGGSGVLAWDANQTRGTLGWRTEQGPHEKTVLDLIPLTNELLSTGSRSADLAHYTHHQTDDRFDVLRSQPIALAADQRLAATDVDAVWQVAAKYYRLIFIDTGNDESDIAWQSVIDHADQIVVATTTRDDHAEAGALLLDALTDRDEHSAHLAQNAVAVVSQADPRASRSDVSRVKDGYSKMVRAVAHIPYDPALVDGWLHWSALRPDTQRAWLAAGAAVAQGL